MHKDEFHQFVAEQFERNLYSLRRVEWRIMFEAYTGLFALAVGYASLTGDATDLGISTDVVAALAVALASLILFSYIYLACRTVERLVHGREMQLRYTALISGAGTLLLNEAAPHPIHRRWWAFSVHLILAGVAFLSVISYIVLRARWTVCEVAILTAALALVALVLFGIGWLRPHVPANAKRVEANPRAQEVLVTEDELTVSLVDGRRVSVPLAWFPRLLHASPAQRSNWQLLGDGEGIHWPDVDEDLSVAGILRGTPAPSKTR